MVPCSWGRLTVALQAHIHLVPDQRQLNHSCLSLYCSQTSGFIICINMDGFIPFIAAIFCVNVLPVRPVRALLGNEAPQFSSWSSLDLNLRKQSGSKVEKLVLLSLEAKGALSPCPMGIVHSATIPNAYREHTVCHILLCAICMLKTICFSQFSNR